MHLPGGEFFISFFVVVGVVSDELVERTKGWSSTDGWNGNSKGWGSDDLSEHG